MGNNEMFLLWPFNFYYNQVKRTDSLKFPSKLLE